MLLCGKELLKPLPRVLAEGKSFSQPGVCERAKAHSPLGSSVNIPARPGSQQQGFLCTPSDWERGDAAGTGLSRSGQWHVDSSPEDVSDSLPDNVVDPKSFGGIELQGVGGSGAATGWDERFPKGY